MRTVLISFFLFVLPGCTAQQTWTAVEAERRRIFTEAKALIHSDHWDRLETIVFNRPRTTPESLFSGVERAKVVVDRERAKLLERERYHREVISVIENKNYVVGAYNPEKTLADSNKSVARQRHSVTAAQRVMMVAEATLNSEEWLPLLDILIDESIFGSGSKLRNLRPPTDATRIERATKWFRDWHRRFEPEQQQ